LARLAVLGGGFTLEAAEAVCAGGEIAPERLLDLVSGSSRKSLSRCASTGESARYRLLETVRQYGVERLAEFGETDSRQRRHFEYFFALAVEPNPTSRRRAAACGSNDCRRELDNIRQTLAWQS